MSTTTVELPLFPLDLVHFPGTVLPLHIFEPRYRQLIQDCQIEQKPFGIVLLQKMPEQNLELPHLVGTLATIQNLAPLPDGRYDLMALGLTRFRILDQRRDKPYLSGLVELFEDEPEPLASIAGYQQRAQQLFEHYLSLLLEAADGQEILDQMPSGAEALSYVIASLLDINNEEKQTLLELTSSKQRLLEEIVLLRREVPFMRAILSRSLTQEQAMLN